MPTVIVVVATAPTTAPPPYFKLIVVSSSSPLTNARAFLPSPLLLLLARHPRCHCHHSLCRPPPSRRRRRRRSPATLFAITIVIFDLLLIVVSMPSPLPLPPSPWPSSLLVACDSRCTHHRPRHRCDRGRSPCSAMPPPAMWRVLTEDRRRLGGWFNPIHPLHQPQWVWLPHRSRESSRS